MTSMHEDTIDYPALVKQKQMLRKTIRSQLKSISQAALHRAGLDAAFQLQSHPHWQHAKAVLLYASMAGEIDTRPLFHLAKAKGKILFYPRIEGEDILFYQVDALRALIPQGPLQILEPRPGLISLSEWLHAVTSTGGERQAPIPLVGIIPGLAFDRQGGRLGKGKGYYDRFLSSIQIGSLPCTIDLYTLGICIEEQVLDQVPRSPFDIMLHEVMIIHRELAPNRKIL